MPKRSKKSTILAMATTLFANKGFTNTSMTEVASMADIAGATIFYHFKTKEDLFVSVLESVKTGIVQEFSLYFQEEQFASGLEMLLGAVAYHLHLASAHREWVLLLRRHYTYELAAVNPICRKYLEDIYTCLVDIFEKALNLGQQDTSILGEISTRKTSLIILAMVDGIIQLESNNLYNAGALYGELITACRRMVENKHFEKVK
jgi:AcrR family transcriptional regulator